MSDTFYITTPIYYVNDKPHIGHAYTTILCDVLARYHRLLGDRVHFLTGTDEHGQKVQQAARKAGITPTEHADRTVVRFRELWARLEITHDDFIRTTEPRHVRVVQAVLQRLYDQGDIYRADYDGWYDVTSETFLTEKELQEGPPPEERPNVVRIQEANYFFRMGKYRDWLIEYIEANPAFIQPDFRRNETLGFLRKPLQDLCVSRPKSRLAWGIELPFDADYVCYVWVDALVNYISAIGYGFDEERFNTWWPVQCHMIGKDILTTHTVYWPTLLHALGVPMPRTVFAHGWWLSGDAKMSKTQGNVVNPMDYIDAHGLDAFRYFLMAEMALGQDASFTHDAFVRRYNADLANDLGNLLNRVLKLIQTHCGGLIPACPAPGADELALQEIARNTALAVGEAVTAMRPDRCVAAAVTAVRETNRYLERRAPWTLAKGQDRAALETVLYTGAEMLRIVSGLLHPVMPGKMGALRAVLGMETAQQPEYSRLAEWGVLHPGTPVGRTDGLFPRIEERAAKAVQTAAVATATPAAPASSKPQAPEGVMAIEFADFKKVELRTAHILQAERVPGADRLLRLDIRVGDQSRQIVAGIAQHYTPESLPGRTIVVVANLKPARIRGLESNGMLLAATGGGRLHLVTVDGEAESGLSVG